MLDQVTAFSEPYRYWRVEQALDVERLAWLDQRMERVDDWVLHDDAFYRAWLHVEPVPAELGARLCDAMRRVTGAPLTDDITLTLQQMRQGQYALPHTDRPLCGYEAARLVLQLNQGWDAADGGLLAIHPDPEGRRTARLHLPERNSAFAFVMGPASFHSVQPTRRLRRTAVFNFWHRGNTAATATWAKAEMAALRFSDLPRALDARIDRAEQVHDPDDTLRAGRIACLLHRWGYDAEVVGSGYQAALRPLKQIEGAPAVLAARWVDHLVTESFPTLWWEEARALVAQGDDRLRLVRRACFSTD